MRHRMIRPFYRGFRYSSAWRPAAEKWARKERLGGWVRLTLVSMLFLTPPLPALPGQTHPPVPAPGGPSPGAAAHFVLLQTLKIPTQPIRGLAFGGNAPTLAAVGDHGAVQVWDAASGEILKTIALPGRPEFFPSLAFSPDGKWIVVSEDSTRIEIFTSKLELLDVEAGRDVRALVTHHWEIESLAFSRNGKWLVSSAWDRKVRVMEFPSGNQVAEVESPSKPLCVAISPDAQVIASGGEDATVTLWERESGKKLGCLTGHSSAVSAVSFSPDGERLASASSDGSARIWKVATGQSLETLSDHVGPVLSLAYCPDGELVATGGADRTVRLWDAESGENVETLGALSAAWHVVFSLDGKYLAAGYADGTINVWKRKE